MVTWRVEMYQRTTKKWIPYGYHDFGSFGEAHSVCVKLQSVGYKVRITRKDV